MSEKKLARVFYADLWGLREKKYEYLFKNDVQTTKWQELEPVAPYYFFVPKDFALQSEYEKFWKVTEIFREWSFGAVTSRDSFVVGFTKDEIIQRMWVFTGNLSDELVKEGLKLSDTGTWNLKVARRKVKGKHWESEIYLYNYRPFDTRFVCFLPELVERSRLPFMNYMKRENIALLCMREVVIASGFSHIFVGSYYIDARMQLSNRGATYFFPLYLYTNEPEGQLLNKEAPEPKRTPNFTPEFLQAIKESLGTEPVPEEIFYYIYAILYSPTYRKRYEEFLKIDFPRIPLPSNNSLFKELSNLGKELVDLHLLKASSLDETEIGFPKGGSNTVEKVSYDEKNQRVLINKDQYFEGISKEVWEYRIGAYQVMEKYLKDRKKRNLSLDEINHYMKVAKAIHLTIELQKRVNNVYRKTEI